MCIRDRSSPSGSWMPRTSVGVPNGLVRSHGGAGGPSMLASTIAASAIGASGDGGASTTESPFTLPHPETANPATNIVSRYNILRAYDHSPAICRISRHVRRSGSRERVNLVRDLRISSTCSSSRRRRSSSVSYTHLRAHETPEHLVCRLL